MRALILIGAFFAVFLASVSPAFSFGPVAPTNAVIPKTKSSGKSVPDLPYKPGDPDGEPGLLPSSDNDAADKPPEEVIDWSQNPFVPSKKIELAPAPDPEME